jgi:hypothetical protein
MPFFKSWNVRLLQDKNSLAWETESGFNFRQKKSNLKNNDFLDKFINESEDEVRRRK